MRPSFKCSLCKNSHVLVRCRVFMGFSVDQRFRFVCANGLCQNCLLPGYFLRVCPKFSFCKITGCKSKHSTCLHQSGNVRRSEQTSASENITRDARVTSDGNGTSDARNIFISVDDQFSLIGAGLRTTA